MLGRADRSLLSLDRWSNPGRWGDRPDLWLRYSAAGPSSRPRAAATERHRFHVTTLDSSLAKEHIVHFLKQRWKTERIYQDLKGEVGLDHYEGRRYPGWHHHVTVALVCYAFLRC